MSVSMVTHVDIRLLHLWASAHCRLQLPLMSDWNKHTVGSEYHMTVTWHHSEHDRNLDGKRFKLLYSSLTGLCDVPATFDVVTDSVAVVVSCFFVFFSLIPPVVTSNVTNYFSSLVITCFLWECVMNLWSQHWGLITTLFQGTSFLHR